MGNVPFKDVNVKFTPKTTTALSVPMAREAAGRNPADRGKKGTKRGLAVGSHGLPIGIVVSGANTHDIKLLEGMGYKTHIRPCGEERQEKEHNPQFVARRRVVEVCHSWMKRFRKLLERYEKKAENYRALVEFACAVVVWRNLIPVHPGLIPG
ncbi:MAG: transposase [Spirochaetaceae bacterium]|jgi:hypothetical protein|nr:transposase [Spirochaetaceae bacterium]